MRREAGRNAEESQAGSETNLQDETSVAHEPSSFRRSKTDCPIAAHSGQFVPGVSFIGCPCRCSRIEVGLHLSSDDDGAVEVVVCFFNIVMTNAFDVTHTEYGSLDRWLRRKSPGLATIV